ncbi:MAG: UDP-N-acetylmuramoyl-L-alanyl-D-glutamate--2,6-diaminopimelate ligase [Gammaproteobacteria bacterium]|nr:UDP-N-acetylmuramoyl-L-alanyl-D-glutamate--2,6-diaminopimelate ligase [Gammaproteobacteria bacterium]
MISKKLSVLLHDFKLPQINDKDIVGLCLDSRILQKGELFFACKGANLDATQFISDAIKKGASAVLYDASARLDGLDFETDISIIPITNLNHQISKIAAIFFDHPAESLKIIGITGTNGKTSCSHFIAAALQNLTIPCGVIGTLGNGIYGNIQSGNLTTPDPITLQKLFFEFVKSGVKYVAMEVSSHSIDQGRINDVPFEIGIFTNLTRDHLDYHGDMETYGAVKKRLFTDYAVKYAVINIDDSFGRSLADAIFTTRDVIAYSTNEIKNFSMPLVFARDIQFDITGLHAKISTPWGAGDLHVNVIGLFNLSNLLAVISALCILDIPLTKILESMSQLSSVPGRMQCFGGKKTLPLVVVDYAHTPDALEKTLQALREHTKGKLYCLFGCGGDRDKGKRPLMASIAERYADKIIVTNDNPRFENPESIVTDILLGFTNLDKVIIEYDRLLAIQTIISHAKAGDCVLIAGKGAETYQIIQDQKQPFSDVEVVKEILGEKVC